MKPITRRFWYAVAILAAAYIVLGMFYNKNAGVESSLYKWALLAVSAGTLTYAAIYTVISMRSPGKWWQNNVGTSLVILSLALFQQSVPLAWVFWFDHGMLTNTWLAWAEVCSPAISAFAVAWLCRIYLRNSRPSQGPESSSSP